MPVASIWTTDHVDFLERLVREEIKMTAPEMAVRMSKQFHARITPGQVNALMHRMRKPSDAFYRDLPYQRRGARFLG
jgi:hypothetical protein